MIKQEYPDKHDTGEIKKSKEEKDLEKEDRSKKKKKGYIPYIATDKPKWPYTDKDGKIHFWLDNPFTSDRSLYGEETNPIITQEDEEIVDTKIKKPSFMRT